MDFEAERLSLIVEAIEENPVSNEPLLAGALDPFAGELSAQQ
jgi:DNA recombination protein RmuC